MPKAKLKIRNTDLKKFVVACEFSDMLLKREEMKKLGDETLVSINFRTPSQLFEAGRLMGNVTGLELDTPFEKLINESKKDAKK
jgi:hypothetical protein